MAEWTMATVLKTVVGVSSPGVRIPLPPLKGFCEKSDLTFEDRVDLCKLNFGEVPEWTIGAAC